MATFQQNLNTALLGLCVAGIAWTLKSINDLDSRMAVQESNVSHNLDAIRSINDVEASHSKTIQDLNDRVLRLELEKSAK